MSICQVVPQKRELECKPFTLELFLIMVDYKCGTVNGTDRTVNFTNCTTDLNRSGFVQPTALVISPLPTVFGGLFGERGLLGALPRTAVSTKPVAGKVDGITCTVKGRSATAHCILPAFHRAHAAPVKRRAAVHRRKAPGHYGREVVWTTSFCPIH